ncbi:MAG: inositol monophosphatase family protein [Alphaproteobacteria bacterium]|nr:MAG: inositol monophosphatase family protein [Alphaproteobacteria bacterium]
MRPGPSDALIDSLATAAHAAADAAARATLAHFRRAGLAVDNKAEGGFDPVTAADREAERAIRTVLAELRPQDGLIGEEEAARSGSSGIDWVFDPIDGTRGFMAGTPTWGTLIAATRGGVPIYGLIDQPYIGERFEGAPGPGGFARLASRHGTQPLATRQGVGLAQAVLFSTFPEVGTPRERQGFAAVAERARLTRYGMDCYAYALLAAGHVDLVIEAGLSAYDIAAPIAVITAAGGMVTDWRGGPAHGGGQVLAAGSAALHEEVLALLAPFAG